MTSQKNKNSVTEKVDCCPARVVGIIGLLSILWFGGYAYQDIPTDPEMIPLVILWCLMFIGGLIDFILVGREGRGALLILVAGIASYLYVLSWPILGWERAWILPSFLGSAVLFISGLLFYLCGRRRKKLRLLAGI